MIKDEFWWPSEKGKREFGALERLKAGNCGVVYTVDCTVVKFYFLGRGN